MNFTKDELYELEKICDIYGGWVNDTLSKMCNTATNWTATHKGLDSPLDNQIRDLAKTQKIVKQLRDKMEKERKKQ